MNFKYSLIITFFTVCTCLLNSQEDFTEINETIYTSALSNDKKTLAVASKKKVYIIDVETMAVVNTIRVIEDLKSKNAINKLQFQNTDKTLVIKIFALDDLDSRYENEDYLHDISYEYDLNEGKIIKTYSGLELNYKNNDQHIYAFNRLKEEIQFYKPKGSYIELREDSKLYINDTLLTEERYNEWKSTLSFMKNSESGILKLDNNIKVEVKGKIRHVTIASEKKVIAIVYHNSITDNENIYTLEIRDGQLGLIAERTYKTDKIIEDIEFVEKDEYLVLYEKKIAPNYYKKQSKTSIYSENFKTDIAITLLNSKNLTKPDDIIDFDKNDFIIDDKGFWAIEDNNIVNYEYKTNTVLNYINTLDFDFHRIRGFYKINNSQTLIVGSAEDEYNKDYITKNGVLKYSLENTELYNKVHAVKKVDTLFNVTIPFLQDNDFTGDNIQFSGDGSTFMSSLNSEDIFQLWAVESRKKLHEIDLKLSSTAYLNQNGDVSLIFSRSENLGNGFLLRKLDVNTGVLTSKQHIISDGETPISADFYHNFRGSKWIGIDKDIIWQVDTDALSYKVLLQKDFDSGYVFNYKLLATDNENIYFKGTAYAEVSKRVVEGVWVYNISSNELRKLDVFTNKKDVFKFSNNKLISYTDKSYTIYDLNTLKILEQNNINNQFIHNVINKGNVSYVLMGDGQRYSSKLKVLEYDNSNTILLSQFTLDINYSDYSDFSNFFATEEGLVYYNDGNLNLYSTDLDYTSKWQNSITKKPVGHLDLSNDGNLIIDGIHNLDLRSLELNRIEVNTNLHDVAQFYMSSYNNNSRLMFIRSYGHSDNNGKAYMQCKLVKSNKNQDVIWASNKINDDKIYSFTNVIWSPDKNYAVLYKDSYLDYYYVADIERQTLTKRKLPFKDRFISTENMVIGRTKLFIYDGGKMGSLSDVSKTYIYDLMSGKLLTKLDNIQVRDELPNKKLLYIDWKDGYDEFYMGHLENKNIIEEFSYNSFSMGNYKYDSKRNQIIGCLNDELFFWKLNEKTPFKSIKFDGSIKSVSILKDKLYLLLWDSRLKIIDLNQLKEILNIEVLERNNILKPIFFTSEGYFKAAKENIRSYHFVKGKDAFSLLNYELFLNRPDIILKRLGFVKDNVINVYKEAYLKRLKRNNLSEDVDYFNLKRPKVELLNSNEIKAIAEDNSLSLSLKKSSDMNNLTIYINGVPVYKDETEKNQIQTELKLNSGLNKITIIGMDKNGLESDPITLEVTNTTKPIQPKIYYVGIGVSKYADSTMNLRYADVDVRSISKLMQEKFGERLQIDTLTNAMVTKANILKLKDKLKTTNINDIVIISFSGHGLVDDKNDFYFATHNIDFNNPSEKGMSYENIQFLLDDIPARKKILLIDACHSGELDVVDTDSSTSIANNNVNSYLPEGAKGSKGSNARSDTSGRDSFELMQSLFYDLDRGNGAFVISAAGGKEFAFESENWGNGVFTYSFSNAINDLGSTRYPEDGKINISELKNYIYKEVSRLTNNQQKPTSRAENLEWDWVLE